MKASKAVSLVFLIILFLYAVDTRPVKPQSSGTIYIRSDGSVDPDTAPISTVDNITYTFTDNIFNQSIVVEKDNIVIDGAGYTLQGLGSGHYGHYGITVTRGVTIKNMKIRGFSAGIIHLPYEEPPSSGTISGNNITNNDRGIVLGAKSRSYTISGNYITTNDCGISLGSTSDNTIIGNTIKDNGVGILIQPPTYSYGVNNIHNNSFINNAKHIDHFPGTAPDPNFKNVWDNGGIGNYWSDYEERYPAAEEIDGSGIWDTPYVIDEHNQDNYPIVPEFPTWTPMLLILIVLTVAIAIYKRRLHRIPFNARMHA